MKTRKWLAVLTVAAGILCGSMTVCAKELQALPNDSYTYWQGNTTRTLVGSRAMYEVADIWSESTWTAGAITDATDIYAVGKELYILDSTRSRLLIVGEQGQTVAEIHDFGGETFSEAAGVLVSADEKIYVADGNNGRILIGNRRGELLNILTLKDEPFIPDDYTFQPTKLALDNNGYLYALSQGSYYGALLFDPQGKVDGFFGANTVNATVEDVFQTLWNRWVLTDAQRAGQVQKIPYQFTDLCSDADGFIYTCTGATSVFSSQNGQLRALGPTGINILKYLAFRQYTDAGSFNFADQGEVTSAVGKRIQDFVGIAVQDGYIYALDRTYGKVFVYDTDCNLLTVLGGGVGEGDQRGTFEKAAALAVSGDRVYVLDSAKGSVTVFEVNAYGKQVLQAGILSDKGLYQEATAAWQSVLAQDRNSQLAYRNLGYTALMQKDYAQALRYSRLGLDRNTYDQAFRYVRNDYLKSHFGLLLLGFLGIIGVCVVAHILLRRRPVRLPAGMRAMLRTPLHPFESFQLIKSQKVGALPLAVGLLVMFYLSSVLFDVKSGFLHSTFSPLTYNSLLVLLGSVGVVLLWTVCNWAVSVLFSGKSSFRNVFLVACCCLIPQIVYGVVGTLLTNVLLINESSILTIFYAVMLICSGIILCVGTMVVQEFDFFKFLGTALLTLIAMAIVIFLIFMIVILVQQFYGFLYTIFLEVAYR